MKWFAILFGGAVVLLASVVGVTVGLTERKLRAEAGKKRDDFAAHAERLMPRYLELARKLEAEPFFSAPRPEVDAGPYLNTHVGWDRPVGSDATGPLALPAGLHGEVQGWGTKWIEHVDEPVIATLDFTWMGELSKYGYWDLRPGGPLERLEPRLDTMPFPNFTPLMSWAKLRLLRARKVGDYVAASRDIRQLAWLCHSTETLLGSMIGIAILRYERTAYDAAVAAHADVTGWAAYEDAWLTAARHTLYAGEAYASPLLPDALWERAKDARVPRCLGLTEATWSLRLRKEFGRAVPASLEQELAHPPKPCHLGLARWVAERSAKPGDPQEVEAVMRDILKDPGPGEWLLAKLYPGAAVDIVLGFNVPDSALDNLEKLPK